MNDDFFLKLSHRVAPLRISSCITLSLFSYSFRVTNAHFIRVFFFHCLARKLLQVSRSWVCSLHCVRPRTTKIGVIGRSGDFRILETFGQDLAFCITRNNLKFADLTERFSDFVALTPEERAEIFGISITQQVD